MAKYPIRTGITDLPIDVKDLITHWLPTRETVRFQSACKRFLWTEFHLQLPPDVRILYTRNYARSCYVTTLYDLYSFCILERPLDIYPSAQVCIANIDRLRTIDPEERVLVRLRILYAMIETSYFMHWEKDLLDWLLENTDWTVQNWTLLSSLLHYASMVEQHFSMIWEYFCVHQRHVLPNAVLMVCRTLLMRLPFSSEYVQKAFRVTGLTEDRWAEMRRVQNEEVSAICLKRHNIGHIAHQNALLRHITSMAGNIHHKCIYDYLRDYFGKPQTSRLIPNAIHFVRSMLNLGLALNSRLPGFIPLMIIFQDPALAKLALDAGAMPHIRFDHYPDPLISASGRNHLEMVLLLLQYGADADTRDHETLETALMVTTSPLVVEALCRSGARVDDIDAIDGYTALFYAACSRSSYALATVQRLIQFGASTKKLNFAKQTVLMLVRQEAVGQYLLEQDSSTVNYADREGDTALHYAVGRGQLNMIKYLVGAGANVNVQNNRGASPLMFATSVQEVTFLLNSGADPNIQDKDKNTAVMLFIANGSYRLVWLCLKHGARVDVRNSEGWTALDFARNAPPSKNTRRLMRALASKA